MGQPCEFQGKRAVYEGYMLLSEQIRDCEERWSDDCYRVAAGHCTADDVSLVGVAMGARVILLAARPAPLGMVRNEQGEV